MLRLLAVLAVIALSAPTQVSAMTEKELYRCGGLPNQVATVRGFDYHYYIDPLKEGFLPMGAAEQGKKEPCYTVVTMINKEVVAVQYVTPATSFILSQSCYPRINQCLNK